MVSAGLPIVAGSIGKVLLAGLILMSGACATKAVQPVLYPNTTLEAAGKAAKGYEVIAWQ